jgi:hypothetical protein
MQTLITRIDGNLDGKNMGPKIWEEEGARLGQADVLRSFRLKHVFRASKPGLNGRLQTGLKRVHAGPCCPGTGVPSAQTPPKSSQLQPSPATPLPSLN